jgi:hypothetical protein
MAPKARSSVAPVEVDEEAWGDLSQLPTGCCCFAPGRTCRCCDDTSRAHWRLAFTVLSAGFLGMVVYLALNAYNVTQASTGGG